jgi:spore germination protein GerM
VRRHRFAPLVAVLVALAVAAVACGVPADDQARPIPDDALPFDLSPPVSGDQPATSGPFTEVVYFYDAGIERLVPVQRPVEARFSVEDRLNALLGGLVQEDIDRSLATFLADGTALASPPEIVENRVVVLDFNGAFTEGQANDDHRKAVAQVVWTVTDIEGISAVLFERNGEVQREVNGDGEQVAGPLNRSDFLGLGPAVPSPRSTTTTGTSVPGGG